MEYNKPVITLSEFHKKWSRKTRVRKFGIITHREAVLREMFDTGYPVYNIKLIGIQKVLVPYF